MTTPPNTFFDDGCDPDLHVFSIAAVLPLTSDPDNAPYLRVEINRAPTLNPSTLFNLVLVSSDGDAMQIGSFWADVPGIETTPHD